MAALNRISDLASALAQQAHSTSRLVEAIRYASMCAVVAGAALCLFHAAKMDLLLLASDPPSLLIYTCATECGLTIAGLLLFSPYWLLTPSWRIALRRKITIVAAATLLLVTIQSLLSLLALSPSVLNAYRAFFAAPTRNAILTGVGKYASPLAIVVLLLLVWMVCRLPDIRRRCELLGAALLIIAPLGLGCGYILLAKPAAAINQPRHVVMIVLDGLGADTLAAIRSDPASDPLAAISPDTADVMVTAMPYTTGFFGTFYTGRLDCERHPSLLANLQRVGVAVRWLSFHRNGFPDTTRCPRSDYRGLRSYALSPAFTAVPRFLGLDFDITLSGHDSSDPDLVDKVLLPELTQLARQPRSFALIHLPSAPPDVAVYADYRATQRAAELSRYAKAHNYTYPPRLAAEAAAEGAQYRNGAARVLSNMARLIAALRRDPALANTIVILTADHGTAFGGGHIYYGYHVDHPVIFTPLLMFGLAIPAPKGVLYTPDLTSTVASLFQAPTAGFQGKPITAVNAGHVEVASLALEMPAMQRWLLALTTRSGTNVYNVDADGDGKAGVMSGQSPFVSGLARMPAPAESEIIHSWLRRFGASPSRTLPRYR